MNPTMRKETKGLGNMSEEDLGIVRYRLTEGSGSENSWIVNCPSCDEEFNYSGFFDPSDITYCKCGCEFKTTKIWIDDINYID